MDELAPNSRYANLERAKLELTDEQTIVYLRRRFLPPAEGFVEVQVHVVKEGERLDQIAAQYLGDPEQFWRICDANNAMRPDDLTAEIGRRLRITLPEGIQGSPYAK
jgi:hypothetical protein